MRVFVRRLKAYSTVLVSILLGLLVLLCAQISGIHDQKLVSVIVLLAFAAVNLLTARVLQLSAELKEVWSFRKLLFLVYGIVGGLMIAALPTGLALLCGVVSFAQSSPHLNVSLTAAGITLIVVAWEELWFRGIYLNYSERYLSPTTLSLVVGLLFMVVHTLNPAIQILQAGPALFFAGALLTMLYLHYRTIWLPIGVHFGNNFFGCALKFAKPFGNVWDSDGYVTAVVLACLFVFFALEHHRSQQRDLQASR